MGAAAHDVGAGPTGHSRRRRPPALAVAVSLGVVACDGNGIDQTEAAQAELNATN